MPGKRKKAAPASDLPIPAGMRHIPGAPPGKSLQPIVQPHPVSSTSCSSATLVTPSTRSSSQAKATLGGGGVRDDNRVGFSRPVSGTSTKSTPSKAPSTKPTKLSSSSTARDSSAAPPRPRSEVILSNSTHHRHTDELPASARDVKDKGTTVTGGGNNPIVSAPAGDSAKSNARSKTKRATETTVGAATGSPTPNRTKQLRQIKTNIPTGAVKLPTMTPSSKRLTLKHTPPQSPSPSKGGKRGKTSHHNDRTDMGKSKQKQQVKPRPTRKKASGAPPHPAPWPYAIDHLGFPHIMDEILSHKACWLAMRGSSKAFYQRVNSLIYRHIIVAPVFLDGPNSDDSEDDASDYHSVDSNGTCPIMLDVAGPTLRLPGFSPRYYDSVWGYSAKDAKKLEDCASLLRFAQVLECPLQLNHADLVWFRKEGSSLKTGRFYFDPDLSYRNGPDEGNEPLDGEFHILPLMLPKIVLLPAQSKTSKCPEFDPFAELQFPITGGCSPFKIVSHVLCTPPHSWYTFIRRFDDGDVAKWFPTEQMVYIFTVMTSEEWLRGHVYCDIVVVALDIARDIYFNTVKGIQAPTIRIVDYPVSEQEDGVSSQAFLGFVAKRLGDYSKGYTDNPAVPVEVMMSGIEFMTREAYAATLAPGEFEEEEMH